MSVTFVDYVKTNKRIFRTFYHRVAKSFWFFRTKRHGNIPTRTFLTGASNAGGVGRSCDSEPVSGILASLRAVNRSSGKRYGGRFYGKRCHS